MAQPDKRFITIPHSADDIAALLDDLFVKPRTLIRKWAEITQQTAQSRLAYPGQHLASLVTGVQGSGTAARGEDLVDGSEVKSCSKADQLGRCKECDAAVPAWMMTCPVCGSDRIHRKDDSHWIISLRRDEELEQLLTSRRIVLVMFDRTGPSPVDIGVRAWEVWPREERHAYFGAFVRDYFENNYKAKRTAGLEPSPCNLHPLKFDHLMMNPVKVFDATIHAPDQPDASVEVDFLFPADADRAELEPEPLPIALCKRAELDVLASGVQPEELAPCLRPGYSVADIAAALRARKPAAELEKVLSGISGEARRKFAMRVKRIKQTPTTYRRRGRPT